MVTEDDLVAVGGPLEPAGVLEAYRAGLFPWYDVGQPPLWWSPDPRAILPLDQLHVPRRLMRTLRAGRLRIAREASFREVMHACAGERSDGTWIHPEMERCYGALHDQGHAHAIGVEQDGVLVGGVYGVAFGGCFAAESMFHRVRDASKVALVALVAHLRARGYRLLDVQFLTPHLERFGCVEISRAAYLARLAAARDLPVTWSEGDATRPAG